MREWLVIESSRARNPFSFDAKKVGYIPRDEAEKMLGRDLGGIVWFTKEESTRMHEHPEWLDDEPPEWSPMGFWGDGSDVGQSPHPK